MLSQFFFLIFECSSQSYCHAVRVMYSRRNLFSSIYLVNLYCVETLTLSSKIYQMLYYCYIIGTMVNFRSQAFLIQAIARIENKSMYTTLSYFTALCHFCSQNSCQMIQYKCIVSCMFLCCFLWHPLLWKRPVADSVPLKNTTLTYKIVKIWF